MAAKQKVDPQCRFAVIEDEDLLALLDAADSKNTKRQIKYAVKVLAQYAETRGGTSLSAVEVMPAAELDAFLGKFYPALRKEDGTLYTKKSMQGIRYGLQRHFQSLRGWDVVKDVEFKESNKSFKAMLVKLKDEGLGYVHHKATIPQSDFTKMQASSSLDTSTPRGLQNKVFVDLMIFLCNRGQENLRSMTPSDFRVETDEDGLRAVTRRDQLTKNNRENADEITGGMMCEIPGDARCPVKSFLEYTSKLHPDCPAFWQKPKERAPENQQEPWYCNIPVGINTLNKKMKEISKEAGCSKIYTNHCLRATCVTVLDRSGFQNRDIMTTSGHHSEQSIKHYSRTSEAKKREMSAAIARKAIQPSIPTSTSTCAPLPVTPEAQSVDHPTTLPSHTLSHTNSSNTSHSRPTLVANQPVNAMDVAACAQPESTDMTLTDLCVLTDSQENRILQDIDISNAFSHQTQTQNFYGCTVNFYTHDRAGHGHQ